MSALAPVARLMHFHCSCLSKSRFDPEERWWIEDGLTERTVGGSLHSQMKIVGRKEVLSNCLLWKAY